LNNRYFDKHGRYPIANVTLETVDGAVFNYFDKKLAINVDAFEGDQISNASEGKEVKRF